MTLEEYITRWTGSNYYMWTTPDGWYITAVLPGKVSAPRIQMLLSEDGEPAWQQHFDSEWFLLAKARDPHEARRLLEAKFTHWPQEPGYDGTYTVFAKKHWEAIEDNCIMDCARTFTGAIVEHQEHDALVAKMLSGLLGS